MTSSPKHPGRPGPEATAKLREHGLPNTGHPKGPPVAKPLEAPEDKPKPVCPNCSCEQLMEITVKNVKMPLLKGGKGIGHYIGCPACPWASPMAVASSAPPVSWRDNVEDLDVIRRRNAERKDKGS